MAQRFGGQFSPGASRKARDEGPPPAYAGARVNPVGARANVMFVPPVLLAFLSLGAGASGLALGLAGAGAWLLGAWLLRDGLKAEAEYHQRKIAHRPAIPRKLFSAVLAGAGMALATLSDDAGLVASVIYGIAAGGLHVAAFGIDPLKSKGLQGVDSLHQDRVARVVDEAEDYLRDIDEAARRAADRQVIARVERFRTTARELIRTVEEDPRDLTAARKYLGVYLMGARDAAVKFADLFSRSRDARAKDEYLELLTDLDQSFGQKTKALLTDTNTDLAVEIDVLRDRLQREGVQLDRNS